LTLLVERVTETDRTIAAYCLSADQAAEMAPLPPGRWEKLLDSADTRWHGPGSELNASIDSDGQLPMRIKASTFVIYRKV
jgi:maltooligosyltrehalose trehalohydrolase